MAQDRFAAQKTSARETLKWLCAILGAAAAAIAAGITVADVPSLPERGLIWLGIGALLFFGATACILRLALRALVAAPYSYLSVKADPETINALAAISKAILPPHVPGTDAAAKGIAREADRIRAFLDRHDQLYDEINLLRQPELEQRMTGLHDKAKAAGTTDPEFAAHVARLEAVTAAYERSRPVIAEIQESGSLLAFNRMIKNTFCCIGWIALPAGLGLLVMIFAMSQKPVAGIAGPMAVTGGWTELGKQLEQTCGPLPTEVMATLERPFPGWRSYTIPKPLACAGTTIPFPPAAP